MKDLVFTVYPYNLQDHVLTRLGIMKFVTVPKSKSASNTIQPLEEMHAKLLIVAI